MRKSKLKVVNEEINSEALKEIVSGHGLLRMGLRVAILQGVLDQAEIKELSQRHGMSRQGIYDLVDRVNQCGIKGLEEEKRSGRTGGLTEEVKADLKLILLKSPIDQGYKQSRWDGPLVRQYLKDMRGVIIGRSQVNVWLHQIGFTLQRGRKEFTKADPLKQEAFIEEVKKTSKP